MSIIHFSSASSAAAAANLIVNLSGDTVSVTDPWYGYGGYRFTAAGTVIERDYFIETQINIATDWITPRTSFNPADYEVRFSKIGGGGYILGGSDPFGSWQSLATDKQYALYENRLASTTGTCVADIRHATDGSKNVVGSLRDAAACMTTAYYYIHLEIN